MNNKQELLRALPKVDDVLNHQLIVEIDDSVARSLIIEAIRTEIDNKRQAILNNEVTDYQAITENVIALAVKKRACKDSEMNLKAVINATGVVLHTNLGRALLADKAVKAVTDIANQYSTLEFDLETGGRGKRYDHIEELICKITGAESAVVVNNNAAAVMLILAVLKDKADSQAEVIVSRGELVEIGGSFRVPDVMEQSGIVLREVGATNKTHLRDYENNINFNTKALLKVHTSNYRIIGFAEEVDLTEMVNLGKAHNIPVIYDLGSGLLYDLASKGIGDEDTVQMAVKTGADIISFSGDKLLGASQAGIIIGKKEWIAKMKKHPLLRAFRIDKLTLAALEATLKIYSDLDRAAEEIPVLSMILASEEELRLKVKKLATLLRDIDKLTITLENGFGQVGGGSMPTVKLPAVLIALKTEKMTVQTLAEQLRGADRAIIARIQNDSLYLDVRTIAESDFAYIASVIKSIVEN